MKNRHAARLTWLLLSLVMGGILWPAGAVYGQAEAGENDEVIRQWKATIIELDKLRHRYLVADPNDQPAIRQQFVELMEKARQTEATVVGAIESQYSKGLASRKELEKILIAQALAAHEAKNDEEAVRLARLLIDGGSTNPLLFAHAVVAAASSGEAELAVTWANEARKRKTGAERIPALIEFELRAKQEIAGKADPTKRLPRVKFETSMGDIVLELCEEEAPNTVANFVSLVENGDYDGLTFHRVIPEFMAQGGDPDGTGRGGPGYNIACECYRPDFRRHFRGSLSMAHAGKDTGGSQFFLTFAPTKHLDGKHTVFGYVVAGFDTLEKLESVGTKAGTPKTTPVIKKATVLNKRDHLYEPQKMGAGSQR